MSGEKMDYSPALSVNSDLTDEELDKYFASYVPLSNLPTPPPAKEHAIPNRASTSTSSQTHDSSSSPELQVYATHLANLVPLNVSTHRPHASVIYGFLERASLPDEIIAFSACILDALSSRFGATWRDVLAPSDYARDLKTFLRTDSRQNVHVSPNVIVLAALSLAHGFLADRLRSSKHWAVRESNGMFTVQEIEVTKRAILQDMDYGLFRISEDRVQRRLWAMQLAAVAPATTLLAKDSSSAGKHNRPRNLSLSLAGAAIWSHGVYTPEPSP
ncbi:Nn.00g030540.m01.CDS01 [Neocucurbitaria sp. VM-36]